MLLSATGTHTLIHDLGCCVIDADWRSSVKLQPIRCTCVRIDRSALIKTARSQTAAAGGNAYQAARRSRGWKSVLTSTDGHPREVRLVSVQCRRLVACIQSATARTQVLISGPDYPMCTVCTCTVGPTTEEAPPRWQT